MDCKLRAKNCGGCPMLATEYAAQLKKKEADVRALLGKYGPVAPIRGMETPYHYRNKVISTFAPAAGGKLTSGIYAARTHKVLPVESCLLQDEVLDKVMLAVRAAANACRYQTFNEDKGTGLLRHCLLRRGVATGQVMVVLVTAQPVLPGAKNFVKVLLAEAEKRGVPVTTVVQNYNPRRTSVVLGEDEKVLYGKGFILDTLCGKTYALSPRSFYQVNPVQTAVLYGLAVDAAHLTGKEVVLDAYCGIGTIGLTASDKARQVVGVEVNRDAVRDAIGNAKHNGVKNARFFAADATAWIREAADAGQKADVVFMDPPREGSTPAFIESVARMAPKRIVYVSCNPETMARDLALLTQKGYRAEGFTPVDMFPHSAHCERCFVLTGFTYRACGTQAPAFGWSRCRPFLYTVLVVSVFSQPQFTTKNEIGNPFRGSLSHFFRWGYFATAPFLFALFCFLRVGNIFFFTCFRLSAPLPQQAAV